MSATVIALLLSLAPLAAPTAATPTTTREGAPQKRGKNPRKSAPGKNAPAVTAPGPAVPAPAAPATSTTPPVAPPPTQPAPTPAPAASPAAVLPLKPAPSGKPSLAVLKVQARQGVNADLATLLQGALTARIRELDCFSRVISADELETLVGLERERMTMDCNSQSCIAEVAGALGADFVVTGNLGRVGDSWVLNASLIAARSASAAGSVSETLPGDNERVLLDAAKPLVGRLARGVCGAGPTASPSTAEVPPSAPRGPNTASPPAAPTEGNSALSTVGRVMLGGGGAGLLMGAVTAVAGVVWAVAGGVLLAVLRAQPSLYVGRGWGTPLSAAIVGAWGGGAVVAAAAALGLLASVGLAGVGVALLVAPG